MLQTDGIENRDKMGNFFKDTLVDKDRYVLVKKK